MNEPSNIPPILPTPPPKRVLQRLFLTLFLRGRSSRGLRRESAPKSIGEKLGLTLFLYALIGLVALAFIHRPVLVLSVYLHGMTFVFLGMFVAASAGEVLFNKEEADILLHRPVTPRALLWAKTGVLVQVSLWLAGAVNLAGFFVGLGASDSGWLFPVAHVISTTLEALFCTSCVVLIYQLCLRWFGRERLEGLMTTAQVLVSIAAVLGGQLLPRMMMGSAGELMEPGSRSKWILLLPPAWFAGFDDAIAGSGAGHSWLYAALALAATAVVLEMAFGRLARDYETGLQTLSEALPARPRRASRRWLDVLVNTPPLRWWLSDSVSRAAFLLTGAYLLRDRDVKLRVYPGLAPVLVFPIIFLVGSHTDRHDFGGFGVAFVGSYAALIPMMGLNLIQYSQQWQATDLFRLAPLPGPSALCHGARRAVLCLLTLPLLLVMGLMVWLLAKDHSQMLLLLPGLTVMPVCALIPCLGGNAVPLSQPPDEAKSIDRGLIMIAMMIFTMMLSGLAIWARWGSWFCWLVVVEAILAAGIYMGLYASLSKARWPSPE